MKIPLEWLKEYVTIRLKPSVLAQRLTMAGLEVVGIEEVGNETVFDLEITPNRADCLSIIGVAREVAAITGERLKRPTIQSLKQGNRKSSRPPPPATEPAQSLLARECRETLVSRHSRPLVIKIEDPSGCARYVGRLISDVRVEPSPAWMQQRLLACGIRPIHNVVDVTNYVLLEYGQPLHAFDAKLLEENRIVVRQARLGESITTLDGIRRVLDAQTLVIADGKKPVAIAGIMGGQDSAVFESTTEVLLESALFDPVSVRRMSRALGIASESSYRFERGVDPGGVELASRRAADLIGQLARGNEAFVADVGKKPAAQKPIALDARRIEKWLGVAVAIPTVRTSLARLGCRVASSGSDNRLAVYPPSFRLDLKSDSDLCEELARLIGYEHIPGNIPTRPLSFDRQAALNFSRTQSLRCFCASLGLVEAMSFTLLSEQDLKRCGFFSEKAVRLANPLSQDHAYLRPSLLMGLLQAVRRNLTQGVEGVRLFEVGNTAEAQSLEQPRLGIILSGKWSRDWNQNIDGDFFRLKGLVESLLSRLCAGIVKFESTALAWASSAEAAHVKLNDQVIGVIGKVSSPIQESLDLEKPVWFAELSVAQMIGFARSVPSVSAPAVIPALKRDLSILLDGKTLYEQVEAAIWKGGSPLICQAKLVDRYTAEPVPAGKASLTFSIEYRHPERTLTAAEVETVHSRITETLRAECGAVLR
ncbi:MAG: phenylalanine--tRNA ligase subunit beta [Candidatus Omnitrophica bacterium]|nr:phenylalanine--tRNA ligase subunit beta [Candidatus Omnitrophota bacterium]MBI3010711.1 phenylalanine--tRNA ligase subunit beta [Candidatus Omnitrophota bacterium]